MVEDHILDMTVWRTVVCGAQNGERGDVEHYRLRIGFAIEATMRADRDVWKCGLVFDLSRASFAYAFLWALTLFAHCASHFHTALLRLRFI